MIPLLLAVFLFITAGMYSFSIYALLLKDIPSSHIDVIYVIVLFSPAVVLGIIAVAVIAIHWDEGPPVEWL